MKFQKVDELKKELHHLQPLPPALIKNLHQYLLVEWTYHSNAMEGNTLSLMETKIVLEEGITIKDKNITEHLEVTNHVKAIQCIEEQVREQVSLSLALIKHVHYLLYRNIDADNAGYFRQKDVRTTRREHAPPHFFEVVDQVDKLLVWHDTFRKKLHIIELVALFHAKFMRCHPFVHGNGRVARLLMNMLLMKQGYPPAIIRVENKTEYDEAVEAASKKGAYEDLIQIVERAVKDSLRLYIQSVT